MRVLDLSACALPLCAVHDVQVGVTSWGYKCAGPTPGVYADVASVRGWIDSTIKASWDAFLDWCVTPRRRRLHWQMVALGCGLRPGRQALRRQPA